MNDRLDRAEAININLIGKKIALRKGKHML